MEIATPVALAVDHARWTIPVWPGVHLTVAGTVNERMVWPCGGGAGRCVGAAGAAGASVAAAGVGVAGGVPDSSAAAGRSVAREVGVAARSHLPNRNATPRRATRMRSRPEITSGRLSGMAGLFARARPRSLGVVSRYDTNSWTC